MVKHVLIDGKRHDLSLTTDGDRFVVSEGESKVSGSRRWSGSRLLLTIDGQVQELFVLRGPAGRFEIWQGGERHVVDEERRGASTGTGAGAGGRAGEDDEVSAPMPAKVVKVSVAAGDQVEEGQTVVVLESMKMELGLTSPRAGKVARVDAVTGVIVPAGQVLVALEPLAPAAATAATAAAT